MSIIKDHIVKMSAYSPPLEGRDPTAYTLLDFNERTLPVGEKVQEALIEYIRSGRLQMYPSYSNTVELIAEYAGVEPEQLMITNGSDQGIELVFRSVCNADDEAIIAGPSFAMYKQCAGIENLNIIEPSYSRTLGFPVEQVIDAVTDKTKIITIANPNNPCGTLVPKEEVLKIARAAPNAAILVDECYFEYCRETVVKYVESLPNLFVTRTFSKTWGIPSLRMGYLISAKKNIKALLNVRGPYDVNQFAIVAVRAALQNPEYTLDYVQEVMTQSKPLLEDFLKEKGIEFWPSSANFIWAFPENAASLEEKIRAAGILVRPKNNIEGKTGLRITLGNLQQTQALLAVLAKYLP